GRQLALLKGHEDWVFSAALSSNGKTVVSASRDKTVRLWDIESGKELTVLKGHESSVNNAAFSPDGKTIVSASIYNTVRLWNAASARELAIFRGHQESVLRAAFRPDGKKIISASADNTMRLWDLKCYELFLQNFDNPPTLYHTFIQAVKFLWQLDVQGLEIVKTKRRTPADLKKYGTLLAPPPPGQSKFDQVLEWAEKQQEK
ncbi:MAG: WD40 repeat domain-containing protein, partial [Candidatus Electrothrix sp. AX5]|nr:WD40 repeat domain-containing protein [Candidatus Electrothrix sp. AX5]